VDDHQVGRAPARARTRSPPSPAAARRLRHYHRLLAPQQIAGRRRRKLGWQRHDEILHARVREKRVDAALQDGQAAQQK
jgi:hypothetical protein